MKKQRHASLTPGIVFICLLTVVFIVLKLLKVISWNWWLVVSPLWIAPVLTVAIIFVLAWLVTKE